ncbi:MAG: hypothetical protein L0H78_09425 [Humibacillus sp.]|nr:hypothetical protein [Humibacillus sp.]
MDEDDGKAVFGHERLPIWLSLVSFGDRGRIAGGDTCSPIVRRVGSDRHRSDDSIAGSAHAEASPGSPMSS